MSSAKSYIERFDYLPFNAVDLGTAFRCYVPRSPLGIFRQATKHLSFKASWSAWWRLEIDTVSPSSVIACDL